MSDVCPYCHVIVMGDGYTSPIHCELVDPEPYWEADSGTCWLCEKLKKDPIYFLKYYEKIVHDNEDKFIETFCKGNVMNISIGVSFDSENIHVRYVLECGQHIYDNFNINEFHHFINTIEN